jgi:Uma2 family endonuclease
MGEAASRVKMTPDEYLAFERASDVKHEYLDGEIFAKSGGTYEHSLLGSNLTRELGIALLDRPCDVHGSDMKIRVLATNRFFYSDASVVCGAPMFADDGRDSVLNPKVIVEVLSDSTERYDRGEKFAHYRRIDALKEYVLVSQTEPLVEQFSRQPDGIWLYRTLGPGDSLVLASLDCSILIDRVYLEVFRPNTSAG